jgi:type VI secretion system secreted protein VgrG
VIINVNSGNWEQNVNSGTITITSPHDITLKSATNINLDAPKSSYTIAGFKETLTEIVQASLVHRKA